MPRRLLVPRPALPRRALVWFPAAAGLTDVERFRAAHDPQAGAIAGHLTLVFPFASSLGAVQVAAHVRRAVARWPALPVRFERLGHFHADWVYLQVTRGHAAVTELHDRLYRGALAPFLRRDLPYEPHLTIGRASPACDADGLIAAARHAGLDRPREDVMRTLTLVRLRQGGTIVAEAEFALG
jgi:2'-5' RNA ligase